MGSKRRLDVPIPWKSMKLLTTNQCYITTTHNTQNSNVNTIDCMVIGSSLTVYATCQYS